MTDKERLKKVIFWLKSVGIANSQQDMAVMLGYNKSSLSQIVSGDKPISEKFIFKLSSLSEKINGNWIKTGEGEMLHSSVTNHTTHIKSNAKPKMIDELNVTIAPLISQYAQAGYLCGFADPEYLEKQPLYVATQKYSGGNYVAFEIRGDSMDNDRRNAICNGDVVLGRELNKDYWKSRLHMPKVFIIVHREEGILLKEIIAHDVESGIITCHSLNPDKVRYPDFTLHLKDVQQLFYMKELRRGEG